MGSLHRDEPSLLLLVQHFEHVYHPSHGVVLLTTINNRRYCFTNRAPSFRTFHDSHLRQVDFSVEYDIEFDAIEWLQFTGMCGVALKRCYGKPGPGATMNHISTWPRKRSQYSQAWRFEWIMQALKTLQIIIRYHLGNDQPLVCRTGFDVVPRNSIGK